ncbi:MAG TPA: TRAP transporter permease DctM/Q [Peptococcaceae bacterium]|nr:TRAP transporter permease DctM/Q [Peptococcaceae bacterium]
MTGQIQIGQNTVIESIRASGLAGQGPWRLLFVAFAVALGVFSLYTGFFGLREPWANRMIHVVLVLSAAFAGEVALGKGRTSLLTLLVAAAGLVLTLAVGLYSLAEYESIILRVGDPSQGDKIIGTALIVAVLLASVRRLGWPITLVALLFIAYALFGYLFPGELYFRGMSYSMFISSLFNQTTGILGVPIQVAAQYVIMFIIFGAFLTRSGAGDFFIKIAFALSGRMWGGPAKAAVVASALMATINGSGVANAVATGSITIPLMKRVGYAPHFAAAVEAAASNGGMIMPPIMASVAFLIAEFTRTPYAKIMLHGLFPALLYFLAVFLMVHFEAKKKNLAPLENKNLPTVGEALKEGWYYLLPIFLLVFMLFRGYSPMLAASVGSLLMVILSYLKKETRMGPWEILAAVEEGVTNTITVSTACAVAGIVVGVITGTGLGIKFSSMILAVAGDSLFLVLVLTMVSSIVLGMGMTAAAVYVIVSALTVPALIEMGVLEMPAHFFVYYYGIASAITPPVALAAYGAAGIAGADQNQTAVTACKLAIVTFLIPFAFVYHPALMAIGSVPEIILAVGTATAGVIALAAGLSGWLLGRVTPAGKVLLVAGGLALISHLTWANIAGAAVLVGLFLVQVRRPRAGAAGPRTL